MLHVAQLIADLAPANSREAGPAGPGSSVSSGSSLTHRSKLVTGSSKSNSYSPNANFPGRQDIDRSVHRTGKNRDTHGRSSRREFSILTLSLLGLAVGMGLIAFGVLLLLGFFPFEDVSPEPAFAASVEGRQVTYGSVIKLSHDKTKYRLHSHEVPYGTGSGQQSVTGFPGGEDSNSYWVVKPISEATARQGDTIPDGAIIRLFHSRTQKWLHSHLHASPISNNYEVSAFGSHDQSDTGDHWRLIVEGKGNIWLRDQKVRLQHIDTGGFLHSHDKKYSRIVTGQQEVCGVLKKNSENIWFASEGVYLPAREGSKE